ncbi:MAG: redox-regulated ATPase YchF [Alphaproteobacteria bacterium]|jgi:GTP-binding protein YchF|nr:redox-regulated ATPase YchF [Alphaproteobacteria bacterium]
MSLNCGIVGLPNVGKSTLFNALTSTQNAQSANYPFCTIDPNKGIVDVPDSRLDQIAAITKSKNTLYAKLEFVDIAGLVRGASKGEGLGNQFLANIKEVDAIIHVVRCFESQDIIHVEGSVDPLRDIEIVNIELMLADLESLEKRLPALEKKAKGGDKPSGAQVDLIKKMIPVLQAGNPIRSIDFTEEESSTVQKMFLMSAKPVLYVCNVAESELHEDNKYVKQVQDLAAKEKASCVKISAQIEQEISILESSQEKKEFLEALGLAETGLDKIIKSAFGLLGLQTYFTSGPLESRAWTIPIGTRAPQAAGVIHSDFERGFIAAEVISFADFIECGGETTARSSGKMRSEGKTYVVKDGDVILFRFNV